MRITIPTIYHPASPEADQVRVLRRMVKDVINSELSTADIKIYGFPKVRLMSILQKYADRFGKVFSGFFNRRNKTFHIANCFGIASNSDALDSAVFDQLDLNKLIHQVKHSTGRNIKARMTQMSRDCLLNKYHEYRIVIGLQEGIHGKGVVHSYEEVAKPLEDIALDLKPVEVIVIHPKQKPYREPAVCVHIRDKNYNVAFVKLLKVLDIARQWTDHVVVENCAKRLALKMPFI